MRRLYLYKIVSSEDHRQSMAAERHGISRIQLETDSSQLLETITSECRDSALSGVLFKGIRELLHDQFVYSKIVNIPRSCNLFAHETHMPDIVLVDVDHARVCWSIYILYTNKILEVCLRSKQPNACNLI
jgi:hypothetical protein